jgi:hypothetical protein
VSTELLQKPSDRLDKTEYTELLLALKEVADGPPAGAPSRRDEKFERSGAGNDLMLVSVPTETPEQAVSAAAAELMFTRRSGQDDDIEDTAVVICRLGENPETDGVDWREIAARTAPDRQQRRAGFPTVFKSAGGRKQYSGAELWDYCGHDVRRFEAFLREHA